MNNEISRWRICFYGHIIYSIVVFGCTTTRPLGADNLKFFRYTVRLPIVDTTGNVYYPNDTLFVGVSSSFTIFKMSETLEVASRLDSVNNVIRHFVPHKLSRVYRFVIHDSASNTAWRITREGQKIGRVDYDSFLKKSFPELSFLHTYTKPQQTIRSRQSITYVFWDRSPKDASYPDTTFFRYSNKKINVPFSFLAPIDTLTCCTALSVRLIFNSNAYPNSTFIYPKREATFEAQPLDYQDTSDINTIIRELPSLIKK